MNDKMQRLLDHFEIRELLEAYVHAQDRADAQATIDVYHPDSWDDHGPIKDTGWNFADSATRELLTRWEGCLHLLGQSRIRVDGDQCGSETYFYCTMTRKQDGQDMLDHMMGRYLDKVERREGEWKIKERTCIVDWSASTPLIEDFVGAAAFAKGKRSAEDLSYRLLGLSRGHSRITR